MGGIIVPERHPPTRIWKRIPAKKVGDTLWDSGQNMAGFAEIKVRGGTLRLGRLRALGRIPDGRGALRRRCESYVSQTLRTPLARGRLSGV